MATLKNTTINDTGYFQLPSGTTAQRPVSPTAGMTRWNTTLSQAEIWNGTTWLSLSSNIPSTVDYLVVAGGGGGGAGNSYGYEAAGGGAGGVVYKASYNLYPGHVYNVVAGKGGIGAGQIGWASGGSSTNYTGSSGGYPASAGSVAMAGDNGQGSLFGTLWAMGGGGGGNGGMPGCNGGSGGGGGYSPTGAYYDGNARQWGGVGVAGQGNAGGQNVSVPFGEATNRGGGGGGAGGAGSSSGSGGNGVAYPISGSSVTYGGGGQGYSGGSAGTGGGGVAAATNGGAGTNGLGGGGGAGGGGPSAYGGRGGNGVVIVRYTGSQRALGGTVTTSGSDTIHTFNASTNSDGTYSNGMFTFQA